MFERATRRKYRFNYSGFCTVEDLWDLNVEALDSLYRNLSSEAKAVEDTLLVKAEKKSAEDLDLLGKIEVIKHVVTCKLAWANAAEKAVETKARKARIMEIMAQKQDETLLDKSMEELQEVLDKM